VAPTLAVCSHTLPAVAIATAIAVVITYAVHISYVMNISDSRLSSAQLAVAWHHSTHLRFVTLRAAERKPDSSILVPKEYAQHCIHRHLPVTATYMHHASCVQLYCYQASALCCYQARAHLSNGKVTWLTWCKLSYCSDRSSAATAATAASFC
jgi:hypothetical protein